MICTNPTVIYQPDPNWDGNPLHGPNVPVLVPCGKCLACRINRRREWTARLLNEEVYSSSSNFITLTYDEAHLPFDENGNMCVDKRDCQLFLKRLRKKYGKGIRYFLNSEYGPESGRPHYHAIIFNLPDDIYNEAHRIVRYENGRKTVSYWSEVFTEVWGNGSAEFAPANKERCGYCAKYFVDRKQVDEILVPNFSLMSRGGRGSNNLGGIGSRYAEDIKEKVRSLQSHSMLSPNSGKYVALPRMYRNRIYSEEERQQQFAEYLQDFELSPEVQTMYENRALVEANQYRAMHYKHIKSKI